VDAKKNAEAKVTLPSDCEIVVVRSFNAPRTVVFEAWSKPEHVEHWYPCEGMTMPVCLMDFREGGAWRWVQRDSGGQDHPLSGEYREIRPPERIVFSQVYEPVPGSDHLVTITFEERGGVTTLTQTFLHQSKQARDGHLNAGMSRGLEATFERLDAVLVALRERR
jgi:uncharacterized protein YndB with AHSA1/START domain